MHTSIAEFKSPSLAVFKANCASTSQAHNQLQCYSTSPEIGHTFKQHPSFVHRYNQTYATMYLRKQGSFLSSNQIHNACHMAGELCLTFLWGATIPLVMYLGTLAGF